jgi:hypothetical protein
MKPPLTPWNLANDIIQPLMLGSVALTVYAEVKGALGRHVNSVDLDRVELSLKVRTA